MTTDSTLYCIGMCHHAAASSLYIGFDVWFDLTQRWIAVLYHLKPNSGQYMKSFTHPADSEKQYSRYYRPSIDLVRDTSQVTRLHCYEEGHPWIASISRSPSSHQGRCTALYSGQSCGAQGVRIRKLIWDVSRCGFCFTHRQRNQTSADYCEY